MTKRIAIIFPEKCHPKKCGDYLCAKVCPVNRTGKDCITKNKENGKAKISEKLCTGCGICPKRCPFDAIKIINLPEELDKEPIHRYGVNAFELFSLPTPVFGKVVGIVGRNGIGKSTAIKILGGILKPNLGGEEKVGYDRLIDYFKGTETQIFFEKLRAGKVEVAYKLQQVDLITKRYEGKVKGLLKEVDERGIFEELVKKLELEKILERDVKDISGGELQRVAIAATMMKKANLYIFDEPTSYLDIKQRLKISKLIRELATDDVAVLVVEHDLIILDYMTDLVHIMYGEEGAYGVVSGLKSTKEGINAFLEGYIKEENIRFRDHSIKFEKGVPTEAKKEKGLCSWKNLKKEFDGFSLRTGEGTVDKEDVIGILGENGIGKSTFVKILAGEIESDEGELDKQVTVSFKPQYLETGSKQLVADFLKETIKKYSAQLINPLNIKPLFTKRLSELSGGELQKVAIAYALGKDVDLFLLDEPSAYLDVEQRLVVSKILRKVTEERGKSVLVVDHDLLFLDYLSEKLIVFDGEPAVKGVAEGPFKMETGMNMFLEELGITFRRDEETNRPRANKVGSVKDRKQKKEGKYYYT